MSLLGDLALGFIVESVVLATVWIGIAVVATLIVRAMIGPRPPDFTGMRVPLLAALAGAVVAGSLAHRFDAAEPLLMAVARREVPIVWSLGGALAGAAVHAIVAGRSAAD